MLVIEMSSNWVYRVVLSHSAAFTANMLWGPFLPPSLVIITGMFSFFGFVSVRYHSRLVTGLSTRWIHLRGNKISVLGERVLIVGAGEVAQFALWLLRNGDLANAFTVVGMVDDDHRRSGMQIDGCQVIGDTRDIPKLVDTLDIGLILYALTDVHPNERESILSTCQSIPVRVIMMPDILDTLRAYFPSDEKDKNELFGKVIQNTTIDKLTGIYNSNQLLLLAEKERPRARRYNFPLSVLIISTDYKQPLSVTITSGTAVNVLQFIAENCQRNIREVDILGRYNNNELVIILPETDALGAKHLAERLYQEISVNSFQTESGSSLVSFKIGIAEDSADFPDAKTLIESAKKSMEANQ